jgi:histidinol phosphatase-like PHP family hydrolase
VRDFDFPVIDYHVHLSQDLGIQDALALAERRGMHFGIVQHPGAAYDLETDADLRRYVARLRTYPVYAGLQPTHLGWAAQFGDEARAQLDYVLMDADTLPWEGDYLYLWLHDNFIDDMDVFVDRYMAHIVAILSQEPIDIFGRPTFLPINFARHYEEIWTETRMQQIIDLAVARQIALEIAENVRVPSLRFVKMAKEAGATFTFGTNGRNQNAGNFHYCYEIAEQAGLTAADMLRLPRALG